MALLKKLSGRKARSKVLVDDGKKTHSPKLELCGLDLNEIPLDIFGTPFPQCLTVLDMSNNNLSEVEKELCILVNLRDLILSGNKLKTIPSEIGYLRKLERFDLSRNVLQCLPRSINNMKELEEVNLSGNNLNIIPEFLLCLPKLCKIFCIRNPNLENIPKEIAIDGLEAMRRYLGIKVEVYENDLKLRYEKGKRKGYFLSEIEQKWVLENEQLVKKTKDVSTQLNEDGDENGILCRKQGFHIHEVSISTQTDLQDDNSIILSQARYRSAIESSPHPSSLEIKKRHKDFDDNQAIENLVKIFHHQIQLVHQYKSSPPELNMKQKSSCTNSTYDDCSTKISQTKEVCCNCGLKRKEISTSEYGSMSSSSHLYDDVIISDDVFISDDEIDIISCDCIDGSVHDDISLNDYIFDESSETNSDDSLEDIWSWNEYRFINACKELVIQQNGVEIKIPEINLSGHCQEEFRFEVVNNVKYLPKLEGNTTLASPIVHVAPHGARFYISMEASVCLPLNIVAEGGIKIKCFQSSTDLNEMPSWQEISCESFEVIGESVIIKTAHFSLFCATASKPYPSITKKVSASNGGTLVADGVKECSIYFPKRSLKHDEDISMTVLFDEPKYASNSVNEAQASPVVALEPSGMSFEEDVIVTLPLPDAKAVYKVNSNPTLIILESQTCINEKPVWKELETPHKIHNNNGTYTVSFNIHHFTLFQAAWSGILSVVETVKKAAGAFVPQFIHRVYFQALMTDCRHSKQFGLCIFCNLAGNPPVTDCNQYPLEVGRSKPRELSKGDVAIELKSKKFMFDQDVGESAGEMIKTETFNGLEFDKHFALKFIEQVKEEIFGKVVVIQKENTGNKKFIAEFLLQKPNSNRIQQKRKPTALETILSHEVAGLLAIEDHWKELGITLGYTRKEVNAKFSSDDPIKQILTDYMSRGGDDNDFIRAMFQVARMLKLIPFDQMMENIENRRLENHIQYPSSSGYCNCSDSPEKTPMKNVKRKLADRDFHDEECLSDGRLDRIAERIAEKWKHVGRALGIEQTKIAEIELNNRYEGGREKAFQMLAVWKEMYPDRCTSIILKNALIDCGLNNTAKRLFIY